MKAAREAGRHVGRPQLLGEFLVQMVKATHHPRRMPKWRLAKEWGVSERTISRALRMAREGFG
ncbi:hypothetical protein [Azospirillum sp. B506]|uniref:hypothetical protein n=1 Tax=Azospirillum sp. B506 TaxID=137721 RepID=UPI0011DDB53A|nr:hypothetical protein [Azospirillum sp. B506]